MEDSTTQLLRVADLDEEGKRRLAEALGGGNVVSVRKALDEMRQPPSSPATEDAGGVGQADQGQGDQGAATRSTGNLLRTAMAEETLEQQQADGGPPATQLSGMGFF